MLVLHGMFHNQFMQGLDENICYYPSVGIALGLGIFNNSISTSTHLMHDVQLGIFNFPGENEYRHFWKVREMCRTFMTLNV
jgi:hypothetical protein